MRRSSQCERLRRVGGDHHLVRQEHAQRVVERLEGVRVADLAPGLEPRGAHRGHGRADPLLGASAAGLGVRGEPVSEPGAGQGRGDHQDLAAAVPAR